MATTEPFNWEQCYQNRIARLQKLVKLNAPRNIIDRELKLVRAAIHKGSKRVVWDDFKLWARYQWVKIKSYRQLKKWAEEDLKEDDYGS